MPFGITQEKPKYSTRLSQAGTDVSKATLQFAPLVLHTVQLICAECDWSRRDRLICVAQNNIVCRSEKKPSRRHEDCAFEWLLLKSTHAVLLPTLPLPPLKRSDTHL